MKTKLSYEKCTIKVQGTTMDCPLCGVTVDSGETHECSRKWEPPAKPKRKQDRRSGT